MHAVALDPRIITALEALVEAAAQSGDPEPTAMSLATRGEDGGVSVRIVLLKGLDAAGLRFFTNANSRKGAQLAADPEVALAFHWKTLEAGVQVRIEGRAEVLPAQDSDAYFATRPRISQIGAWASLQSARLEDRATFEARIAHFEKAYANQIVPRPPHWGGWLVRPRRVEFWHARSGRLHERSLWTHDAAGAWGTTLLYP